MLRMLHVYLTDIASNLTYSKNISVATFQSGFKIERHCNLWISDQMRYLDTVLFSIDPNLTELQRLKIYLSSKEAVTYGLSVMLLQLITFIKNIVIVGLSLFIITLNEFF